MTRTLRYLLLFVFTGLSGSAFAQEISGRVLDDKKEPLPSAVVQVYQGGILKGGNVTDYDGNYTVKPLDPGYYDVLVLYAGYDSIMTTGVIVSPNQRTTINVSMARKTKGLAEFVTKAYKIPLVDQDKPASHILTREDIATIPTDEVTDLVSTAPGVYQQQRGQDVYIGGARNTGTLYIVDGIAVQGTVGINMAQASVDQLEVITSGIPANYGDVSGGVVNITSRGISQKLTGEVRLQHSIDGYNNNLGSFSVAGPLFKKMVKDINGKDTKKPVLGFALSGDFYDDNERYPTYYEQYTATSGALKSLLANPLNISTNSTGQTVYNYSSEYVTQSDINQTKILPNDVTKEARLNAKLDYQVTDNMHIVGGGTVDYTATDQYSTYLGLFSPAAIPVLDVISGRAYLRFTQKFGKAGDTSSRHSIISNAFYSIQADYQKDYQNQQDPTFKKNMFDYAYVGQFNETRQNVYFPGSVDSLSGRQGTVLQFSDVTGISYNRNPGLNPNLENYTSEYYNSLNGLYPTSISQIQADHGIANGDEPLPTYSTSGVGLFASPGTTQSYFYTFNSNQYAITVDANFDLQLGNTKHAIEFGLYYQQRVEKEFEGIPNPSGSTNSIWQQMRALVSSVDNGNLVLDKQHPIFVVNGKDYTLAQVQNGVVIPGPQDTIIYNYKNIGNSTFDQNLRKALGYNSTQDINIDALSPSTFNLGMFSADELLNYGGNTYVYYYGYTYTGGAQGNVNFNDFWTAKDASGNYTRPIGAFSPNYIAGYLLDKFTYKDIHFNVGLRIDRYDANTSVLIDPYSEYAEKTVSQVPGSENLINGGQHPANIGGGYVVYINDNNSTSPYIVGYRNGDNWYTPTGALIQNPAILETYSGGLDPQPDIVKQNGNIVKITDSTFNPNGSFTAFTPAVLLQPRLSFSFPISDVANFYAHYDIYSQRPTQYVTATAYTYYNLENNSGSIIDNANLKPMETFDYEVGFQQKLSKSSALTLSSFYKERKDMTTMVPYLFAYPVTYYTFGNRDFSTTKGTTLSYDLRATNHLSMKFSYTLQFAEGTGSSPTSTNANGTGQLSPNGLLQQFIQAGLPNLRYVSPLTYDSRHNIVANINYGYGEGEGPIIAGNKILQNAGVSFIAKARSGEPYTAFTDAEGNTVIGGVNGSRLPWHYGIDMRLDKNFALARGQKHNNAPEGVKPKRPLYLKAIIQANNLLQTKDILQVYGYTGRPNDNGYLASSYGQQYVPEQISPQAYALLYQIYENNPNNYNYARTINFALEFNF